MGYPTYLELPPTKATFSTPAVVVDPDEGARVTYDARADTPMVHIEDRSAGAVSFHPDDIPWLIDALRAAQTGLEKHEKWEEENNTDGN